MACKRGCVCSCQETGCLCATRHQPLDVDGKPRRRCTVCGIGIPALIVHTDAGATVEVTFCPTCDGRGSGEPR